MKNERAIEMLEFVVERYIELETRITLEAQKFSKANIYESLTRLDEKRAKEAKQALKTVKRSLDK